MATFAERIKAYTNFDADSGGNAFDTTTYQTLTNQWLNDGVVEIVNQLSKFDPFLFRTEAQTSSANLTDGNGVDMKHKVITVVRANTATGVTLANANNSQVHICREIPATRKYEAQNPESIYFATAQDPIYYLDPQSDGGNEIKIHVLPLHSSAVAQVTYHKYHSDVTYDDTEVTNFPKEYESLVILYTSIKASEFLLAHEEDVEIYIPMITNLKQSYQEALASALNSYGVNLEQQRG